MRPNDVIFWTDAAIWVVHEVFEVWLTIYRLFFVGFFLYDTRTHELYKRLHVGIFPPTVAAETIIPE